MRGARNALSVREFEGLFRHGTAPPGDRALLDWFLAKGEHSAFEAIVTRHGPMVRGVCGRLLGRSHDADDAFQATFLVLIQKARRLRDPDRLGPWLYGVATRVATRTRKRLAVRRDRDRSACDELPARDEQGQADWFDVLPILDVELGRLPSRYREVLVICLLEGSTVEEAAGQLACPLGTVKSRLARGRETLKARLTSRGIVPALAAALVASSSSAFASPVSKMLIRATMITCSKTGASPTIVALTQGVALNMFSKSVATITLICGGIAFSTWGATSWMKASAQTQEPRTEVSPALNAKPAEDADRQQAQSINHLKMILLAVHNFIASTPDNQLPPAAIYGTDGQPRLSWRVGLLPYLNQQDLYNQFHLDEPWDSPHNKALIARMPDVFTTPGSPAEVGFTRIRGFAGKGAIFDGVNGVRLAGITDGTSNTLMVALAQEPVPWTQPGELPFLAGQPLPKLDASNPRGYLVAMADGFVKHVTKSDETLLRNLITRNGGEVIDASMISTGIPSGTAIRMTQPPPITLPVPTIVPQGLLPGVTARTLPSVPNSSEVERRLQKLEDKLDRIIQKLDGLSK